MGKSKKILIKEKKVVYNYWYLLGSLFYLSIFILGVYGITIDNYVRDLPSGTPLGVYIIISILSLLSFGGIFLIYFITNTKMVDKIREVEIEEVKK